jgi:hypothetical protein
MTVEQVERAFNRAIELSGEAVAKLPEGCVGQPLIQSLFAHLITAEEDTPHDLKLKEAA